MLHTLSLKPEPTIYSRREGDRKDRKDKRGAGLAVSKYMIHALVPQLAIISDSLSLETFPLTYGRCRRICSYGDSEYFLSPRVIFGKCIVVFTIQFLPDH